MRGSLRAAQKAANAAKQSAEHVRRTERAWIIVESNGPPGDWYNPPERFLPFQPKHLFLKWMMRNHGKTPAWITFADVRFEVHPWPLPDEPFSVTLAPWHDKPVTSVKPHDNILPRRVEDETTATTLFAGGWCLVFYGMVTYRDAFNNHHWTRFCETWRVPQNDTFGSLQGMLTEFTPFGPTPAWTEHD